VDDKHLEITVANHKEGTDKTTIAVNLALILEKYYPLQFLDCDVDAANLYLLRPQLEESYQFAGGEKAKVYSGKCTGCGECLKACRFSAIKESKQPEEK